MSIKWGVRTLESRIYIIFTVVTFFAILIMQTVIFNVTIKINRNSALNGSRTLLNELVLQIDSYITDIERLSQVIVDDEDIQNNSPEVQNVLEKYMKSRLDISNILLVDSRENIILADKSAELNKWVDVVNQEWYKKALNRNGRAYISTSYVQNIIANRYTWVISISREILSIRTGEVLGVLLVDLKFNRIDELCRSMVMGSKGYGFILDDRGNYIYHPKQQLIYSDIIREPVARIQEELLTGSSGFIQENHRFYISDRSAVPEWNVMTVLYESDIGTDWNYIQIIYALVGLVLFATVGIITNRVASGITKPIKQLQTIMQSVEHGEFKLIGSIKGTKEIQALAHDYDIMVTRIRELVSANTLEQELKRKSDLKALQAQINPHFLYNTLDSIIWMGEMGLNREVVRMTSALSKLFRISISKGHEIITIRDEIDHIKSYLTIQEMRYQDKFEYLIDIDPELYNLKILKITLQPIIENAIYHGIKSCNHKGFIRIKGSIINNKVTITVEDNGSGMDEEKLKGLVESVSKDPNANDLSNDYGMGLRNVHQRLMLYFGLEFGLEFTSQLGNGTKVTVILPIIEKDVLC